ncbi:MAG TPA: chemotaxis protein CheW [Rhodanobacteraceae bacterium]|jgi:chemosensory pili system protein ChpC|nr:chemotaxis protein CheW [Rhodanobacteraceae bacterium]
MSAIHDLPREVRGVMIPVTHGRVLLPNATVAEVVTYSTLEPIPSAPAWLLGRQSWRGWRVPLFSFSVLAGLAPSEGTDTARVAILKALEGHPKMPFLGLLTQGFPRLTTISPDILIPSGDGQPAPAGVREQVMVRDDLAFIPDLAEVEDMVQEALNRAA